jgi:hypothetical protein
MESVATKAEHRTSLAERGKNGMVTSNRKMLMAGGDGRQGKTFKCEEGGRRKLEAVSGKLGAGSRERGAGSRGQEARGGSSARLR